MDLKVWKYFNTAFQILLGLTENLKFFKLFEIFQTSVGLTETFLKLGNTF